MTGWCNNAHSMLGLEEKSTNEISPCQRGVLEGKCRFGFWGYLFLFNYFLQRLLWRFRLPPWFDKWFVIYIHYPLIWMTFWVLCDSMFWLWSKKKNFSEGCQILMFTLQRSPCLRLMDERFVCGISKRRKKEGTFSSCWCLSKPVAEHVSAIKLIRRLFGVWFFLCDRQFPLWSRKTLALIWGERWTRNIGGGLRLLQKM